MAKEREKIAEWLREFIWDREKLEMDIDYSLQEADKFLAHILDEEVPQHRLDREKIAKFLAKHDSKCWLTMSPGLRECYRRIAAQILALIEQAKSNIVEVSNG